MSHLLSDSDALDDFWPRKKYKNEQLHDTFMVRTCTYTVKRQVRSCLERR